MTDVLSGFRPALRRGIVHDPRHVTTDCPNASGPVYNGCSTEACGVLRQYFAIDHACIFVLQYYGACFWKLILKQ